MLFSSMTFIYVFLPIVLLLYLTTKKELHNPILLIASIIFYAWGEPKYLAIMLLTILVNYFGAIVIEKYKTTSVIQREHNNKIALNDNATEESLTEAGEGDKSKNGGNEIYQTPTPPSAVLPHKGQITDIHKERGIKQDKLALIITILINLGFLIYFKYFNFLIENCNALFHSHISALNIVMPIGISFYTFQALSYVIDVYRGECKAQKDIYKLALYICLFPQLIAGPIVKYHDIEEQIDSRIVDFDKVNIGVKRFIIGLSKKVLIANTMGAIADKIFAQNPHNFSHLVAWIGSFAYTFQLYFDFSGYSDMAIGLGLIFGFKFMENFNYPYISKSITEFWRRWHISLSTWFKQYVYIPLGGNRHGMFKTCRNLGIVFLLTGIWHGANWTFLVWGAWHGFFIIIEKLCNIKEFDSKPHAKPVNFLRHLYCIAAFGFGWVLFRSDNIKYAWDYLMNMFGLLHLHTSKILYTTQYYVGTIEIIIFIVAILCSMPIFRNMIYVKNKIAKGFVNAWLLVLFFLSTISIAAGTYNPFIYFRF